MHVRAMEEDVLHPGGLGDGLANALLGRPEEADQVIAQQKGAARAIVEVEGGDRDIVMLSWNRLGLPPVTARHNAWVQALSASQ